MSGGADPSAAAPGSEDSKLKTCNEGAEGPGYGSNGGASKSEDDGLNQQQKESLSIFWPHYFENSTILTKLLSFGFHRQNAFQVPYHDHFFCCQP